MRRRLVSRSTLSSKLVEYAIEFNREVFDRLAARTLKIPHVEDVPLALTKGQRLRAVTKWMAAGLVGTPAGAFLHPLLGSGLAGATYRLVALFDP